MMSSLREF